MMDPLIEDDDMDISTVELGDTVSLLDPQGAGECWEVEVTAIDAVKRTVTIKGWCGKTNKRGGRTTERRRVPMADCAIMRRAG